MMNKENVVIIFGGCSSEYAVSLHSAYSVIQHLDTSRYNPLLVGITKEGDWYLFTGDIEDIAKDRWNREDTCLPLSLSLNRSHSQLWACSGGKIQKYSIDVAFPVMHGKNGEDGTIQGLFELANIPYAGCGVLASALCMDKDKAHQIAALAGIRVPKAYVFGKEAPLDTLLEKASQLGYPLFVKPVEAGSSFGISRIKTPDELPKAVAKALEYDNRVIIEENIQGFEVGCAVMGNDKLITGEIDEIELEGGFFDYTEKYNLLTSSIHLPARIPAEKAEEVKQAAKTVYKALGCKGFARVDFFLTPQGEIVFNEVNTIPGFTEHSRFPSMMKAKGLTFSQQLTFAIELAVKKC